MSNGWGGELRRFIDALEQTLEGILPTETGARWMQVGGRRGPRDLGVKVPYPNWWFRKPGGEHRSPNPHWRENCSKQVQGVSKIKSGPRVPENYKHIQSRNINPEANIQEAGKRSRQVKNLQNRSGAGRRAAPNEVGSIWQEARAAGLHKKGRQVRMISFDYQKEAQTERRWTK